MCTTYNDSVFTEKPGETSSAILNGELLSIRDVRAGPIVVVLVVDLCKCKQQQQQQQCNNAKFTTTM